MHAYTRLVETYFPPSTIHTRRWRFWFKFFRCWETSKSSEIIKEVIWNCVGSDRKQILWNYAGMGLRKQNSWLNYAKLRTYKTKVVWPPQSIKTTTCATKSTTTFFQFTKICTYWWLTPVFKRTHETYTTDRRIFLILGTGDQPNYNQNPQHIGNTKICNDRKHQPGCKTLSQLMCHTSLRQNTIFASEMILQVH